MTKTKIPVATISRIAHDADESYCAICKDEGAFVDDKEFSLLVRTILEHPEWQAGDLHSHSVRRLQKKGWRHGEEHSAEEKTSPVMTEHHLSGQENIDRNTLLLNVVRALASV